MIQELLAFLVSLSNITLLVYMIFSLDRQDDDDDDINNINTIINITPHTQTKKARHSSDDMVAFSILVGGMSIFFLRCSSICYQLLGSFPIVC